MLATHTFCSDNRTHFPAGVFGIEVIEQVADRGEIAVSVLGIHAIVHGDEAYIHAGKYDLGVVTHLQIVSPKAAHVLHDDRTNLPSFYQGE